MKGIDRKTWIFAARPLLLAVALVATAALVVPGTGTKTLNGLREVSPAGSGRALTVAAQATPAPGTPPEGEQPWPYYTLTPEIFSHPLEATWVQAGSDWVAYASGAPGCGHCATVTGQLYIRNPHDVRKVSIRGSYWSYNSSVGGGPVGITSAAFEEPYLVWSQPGKTVPNETYTYSPGDFDCTVCFYNLTTGKGGPIAAFLQDTTDPESYPRVLDVTFDGWVLARSSKSRDLLLGNLATGEKRLFPVNANPGDIHAGALYLDETKIVWLEGDRLLAYSIHGQQPPVEVARGVDSFRLEGVDLFWHDGQGLWAAAIDPLFRVPSSPPDYKVLVLPGIGSSFDVSTSFLNVAAWVEQDQSGYLTLKVAEFDRGAGGIKRVLFTQEGGAAPLSLSGATVFYSGYEPSLTPGSPGTYLVHLAGPVIQPEAVLGAFGDAWANADKPVAQGTAARSWLWGPKANFLGYETLEEGKRLVQYWDKSRMEINNPIGDTKDPYYVSNGLLATEMIAGEIQLGDSEFITAGVPCTITAVGDPRKDNPLSPSYATLKKVSSLYGENKAANMIGQWVDAAIDVNGVVSKDRVHSKVDKYAAYAPETGHNIPDLFWSYLQKMKDRYGYDWVFVLGFPISEAYWTQMRVGGKDLPVMIQAYQRRVLTYVPDFQPEWRVQMGNVGQHYYEWRYVLNR